MKVGDIKLNILRYSYILSNLQKNLYLITNSIRIGSNPVQPYVSMLMASTKILEIKFHKFCPAAENIMRAVTVRNNWLEPLRNNDGLFW